MSYSHPLPNVEEMAFLKVDNLANFTSSSTLKRVFEDYGPVGDVYISENHLTEEPYRVAFIHFYNKRDAETAMVALNGTFLDGYKLRVQMVHNDIPQHAQPSCGQGGQYHFEEDNHEYQSNDKRHCCSSTSHRSRSQSRSSPDHSESLPQSLRSHRRLSSSTKRSKSKSSMSDHQLREKSCPRSRHRPREKKKSKSRSSRTHAFECPEGGGGGENMENKQLQTENSDSDVIFVRAYQLEGNRSESLTTCPPITSQNRINNVDFTKKEACDGGEDDPLHNMLSCDIASYQSTTCVVMEEEKRECQSWMGTSPSESQVHTFMEGDSVNDNNENPDLKYDHLYFARLLGEENMQNNERLVESEQSKSIFNSPRRSEANATDTLIAAPSTRSRTRKRRRSQQNWRERPRMESEANSLDVVPQGNSERDHVPSIQQSENRRKREHMKNNQKQMEYLQSEPTSKKPGVSKEHKCEVLMLYNSSQKRTRRRGPGLPKANNCMRCGANSLDIVPQGNSERDHVPSIQQSENRRKRFSCHGSNRNGQKQLRHQQPESTCVIPFTSEEDTTEILMEDPLTRDRRNTRSASPEVLIVGEMTESRPPQPIHQVALVKGHHPVSPETFPHLNMHEPLSNGRPAFPLNISELQTRHSFTSSPTRRCTAHRNQSTSVTPANFINVEINRNEHTNIFSHSNEGGMPNSEIISVAQTSNTGLEIPLATVPYGTSGQMLTQILEVEHDNCPESVLEARDSSSSQNNTRVHSGESSISSFVSSSFSHSTSNTTISSLHSLSTPRRPILQIPIVLQTTIIRDENLPATFEINESYNEPILSSHTPSEARRARRFAGREESDDSDSWPFLPNFANFNDIHNNHPRGLTKEQINSLPIRSFCENDRLNICTICLAEYTESSRIRILPCSHEYHDECIDNWLPEKSNCPICRRQVINPPDDTEIPF
ncbi:uncharacterized protein LOC102908123 isoform X2 [Peromyscus maniculatus bairdii]|uniref:uncharacterized protein LOC102908123 isoform X2 n=1 Tax=Peromyscus maniculatus bairdii TaxID=230844 RepID=UPI003FD01C21